jgi:hypothetical protein
VVLGHEALIRGPQGSRLHAPLVLFDVAQRSGRLMELELYLASVRSAAMRPPAASASFSSTSARRRCVMAMAPSTVLSRYYANWPFLIIG